MTFRARESLKTFLMQPHGTMSNLLHSGSTQLGAKKIISSCARSLPAACLEHIDSSRPF